MTARHLCRMLPPIFFALLIAQAHAESEYPNLETACANNPERCEQARAKIAAKCQADPAGCAEKKAKLEQRISELKTKCAADPQACEEKKSKLRERLEQRRQEKNN